MHIDLDPTRTETPRFGELVWIIGRTGVEIIILIVAEVGELFYRSEAVLVAGDVEAAGVAVDCGVEEGCGLVVDGGEEEGGCGGDEEG